MRCARCARCFTWNIVNVSLGTLSSYPLESESDSSKSIAPYAIMLPSYGYTRPPIAQGYQVIGDLGTAIMHSRST